MKSFKQFIKENYNYTHDEEGHPIPTPGGTFKWNRIQGDPYAYTKNNTTRINTKYGPATVSKDAAVAYKGFFDDMHKAGAPIRTLGSHNIRQKNSAGAGHNPGSGWSQHSYGNAIDIDNTTQLTPAFQKWRKENPGMFTATRNKWGMNFPKGDEPHMEFGGSISQDAYDEIQNRLSKSKESQTGSQIARPAGSNTHSLEPQPTKPTEKKPETVTAATPPFVDDKSTKSPEVKQQTTGNVRTPPFVDDKPTEPKLVEPPTVVRTGTTKETQPAPASKPLGSSPGANADRQPETQPAPAQPAAPAATPPTTLKTFRQKAADSTDSDSGGYSGRSSGSDSYSGRSSGSDGSGGDDWRNRAFAGTGSNRG